MGAVELLGLVVLAGAAVGAFLGVGMVYPAAVGAVFILIAIRSGVRNVGMFPAYLGAAALMVGLAYVSGAYAGAVFYGR